MNLILLAQSDILLGTRTARISGRRLKHVLEILKPKLNDALTVGLENGLTGEGQVVRIDKEAIELTVSFRNEPPAKLPVLRPDAAPGLSPDPADGRGHGGPGAAFFSYPPGGEELLAEHFPP
jgi:hypothetical protein